MGKLILHPPAGASLAFDKDEVSVGRDPQNDLVIPDGSVSRRHARLLRRSAGWAVVDQGSANGTFLDSHRVADAALRAGQELRFGAMPFRVEIEAAAEELASTLGRDSGATVVEPSPLSLPTASPAEYPTVPALAPLPPASSAPPPPPAPPRLASRPAAGAPLPPPAAGAAKKGKGPLFWIGLGCGGCLTMLLGFVALLGGGLYYMASGPVDAVAAHVRLLREGQPDAAYAQLTDEYQQQLSREEYAELLAAHPGLSDNAEVQAWPPAGSFKRVNDKALVSAVLVSKSGAKEKLACALQQVDGDWRIASLSFETGP